MISARAIRAAAGVIVASVAVLVVTAAASASAPPVISAQAQAANVGFLAYAPPPAVPGAMCLVDTGVSPLPDTSPELVYATALDGGTPDDVDPEGHGTLMAILAGGQGHGLRGIWPSIKIVSVRATSSPVPGQQPTYQYQNYVQGMTACLQQAKYGIRTVDLSLSSTIAPTPDQSSEFAQVLGELTSRNIAVVAAAGNAPGKVQYPAGEPGVLSVGASTLVAGGPCSFSASETVAIWAPGCELDFADPTSDEYVPNEYVQGTSQAADITDASLTALMTYDEAVNHQQLTVAQAENLLVTTATGGHLNVAGAFEAAGLGSIVAAGNAAIPPEPTPTPAPAATPTSTTPKSSTPGSVPAAHIRGVSWQNGILTVRLRSLPRGDRLHVSVLYRHRKARTASGSRTVLRIRCPRPQSVRVWITDGNAKGPASTVRISSPRRKRHDRHH